MPTLDSPIPRIGIPSCEGGRDKKVKWDVVYGWPFELNGGVDVVAFDNNQVRSGR